MRVEKNIINKINKNLRDVKNKKYLHEDKKEREKRKAREYVKKWNKTHADKIYNGVGNINAKKIYAKRTPRSYEICERKSIKNRIKTAVILLDGNEITVEMGIVKFEKVYEKYLEEMDKEYEKIIVTLPKYKMNILVEKIEFDNIPEKIKYEGEEIERSEIFSAILGKNTRIYRALEIL